MGEPVSQYGDVLAEDLPDGLRLMRQAWRFIAARLGADVVCLRKVRADAAVAPLLRELGMRQTDAAEAPYLDLASAPDFAGYELRYTGKARKNRRRLARRLAEQGPLAIERHTGGAEARAAAPQAVALKREWIKHTGRVSRALGGPALRRLLRRCRRRARAARRLRRDRAEIQRRPRRHRRRHHLR